MFFNRKAPSLSAFVPATGILPLSSRTDAAATAFPWGSVIRPATSESCANNAVVLRKHTTQLRANNLNFTRPHPFRSTSGIIVSPLHTGGLGVWIWEPLRKFLPRMDNRFEQNSIGKWRLARI